MHADTQIAEDRMTSLIHPSSNSIACIGWKWKYSFYVRVTHYLAVELVEVQCNVICSQNALMQCRVGFFISRQPKAKTSTIHTSFPTAEAEADLLLLRCVDGFALNLNINIIKL